MLDIGCNSGELTIALAARFGPAHTLGAPPPPRALLPLPQPALVLSTAICGGAPPGVDIDASLIKRAEQRLATAKDAAASADPPGQQELAGRGLAGLSFKCENIVARVHRRRASKAAAAAARAAAAAGRAVARDVVPDEPAVPMAAPAHKRRKKDGGRGGAGAVTDTNECGSALQSEAPVDEGQPGPQDGGGQLYDMVLCFSVTKWVHLNWGDAGLAVLFRRVWDKLTPGGLFVLEPQPWRSYKKVTPYTHTHPHPCLSNGPGPLCVSHRRRAGRRSTH